ncbi:hypothetical protein [Kangiella sp. TOML190]|uniref:hypothetical protein n=1 Tax=Kangiella sp. TOML190 TaxID=2931351 RepID=UPI00203B1D0A|nr:hypothetical protein [Kangiella sp. TOML190]
MNKKQFEKLEKVVDAGKDRFIIKSVLKSLPLIAINPIVSYLLGSKAPIWTAVMIGAFIWPIFGFLFGILNWNQLFRKYRKHKKQFVNNLI